MRATERQIPSIGRGLSVVLSDETFSEGEWFLPAIAIAKIWPRWLLPRHGADDGDQELDRVVVRG
jgi:hypothetical protein